MPAVEKRILIRKDGTTKKVKAVVRPSGLAVVVANKKDDTFNIYHAASGYALTTYGYSMRAVVTACVALEKIAKEQGADFGEGLLSFARENPKKWAKMKRALLALK